MKRTSGVLPGFDCGTHGSRCKHEKKGDHGISGGTWWYAVSDGAHAVSLSVLAANYPDTVRRPLPECLQRPKAEVLSFHRADPHGAECEYVDGGRCIGDATYLGASEFWEAHGNPAQNEQSEEFWIALECRLPEAR